MCARYCLSYRICTIDRYPHSGVAVRDYRHKERHPSNMGDPAVEASPVILSAEIGAGHKIYAGSSAVQMQRDREEVSACVQPSQSASTR